MANLDSRSKRASSVQVLSPWQLSLVLPDGTIAQADRQHAAWSYSGIAALVVVSSAPTSRTYAVISESRVYPVPQEKRVMAVTDGV